MYNENVKISKEKGFKYLRLYVETENEAA